MASDKTYHSPHLFTIVLIRQVFDLLHMLTRSEKVTVINLITSSEKGDHHYPDH